jgi:hypothetical protein
MDYSFIHLILFPIDIHLRIITIILYQCQTNIMIINRIKINIYNIDFIITIKIVLKVKIFKQQDYNRIKDFNNISKTYFKYQININSKIKIII